MDDNATLQKQQKQKKKKRKKRNKEEKDTDDDVELPDIQPVAQDKEKEYNQYYKPDFWSHDWEPAIPKSMAIVSLVTPKDLLCWFHYIQMNYKHIPASLRPWYNFSYIFFKQLRTVLMLPFLKAVDFERNKKKELDLLYKVCTKYKDGKYYQKSNEEKKQKDKKYKTIINKLPFKTNTIKKMIRNFCDYYTKNFGIRYQFDDFQMLFRDDLTTNAHERSNRELKERNGTKIHFDKLIPNLAELDVEIHNNWKSCIINGYFPRKSPALGARDAEAKAIKIAYIKNRLNEINIQNIHEYLQKLAETYSDRLTCDLQTYDEITKESKKVIHTGIKI